MNVSKQFTRRLLAAMVSGSLMLGAVAPAGASGIPVVDIVGNAQTAANFIKEMAEMANQLNTMKSQLEQQRQQFKALTGSRNWAIFLRMLPLIKCLMSGKAFMATLKI